MSTAPKRSLFKKPAWASAPTALPTTNTDFYRHSDTVYKDIVADNERRRQRRLEKKAKSGISTQQHDYTRDSKRRRLSQEGELEDDLASSDNSSSESTREGINLDDENETRPSMRRAVAKSKIKTRSRRLDPDQEPSPPPVPIPSTAAVGKGKEAAANLCDDSDSEIIITNVKQTPAEIIQASSDDSDSDEYVRELKRKAREKKRNQLLDAKANSTTPDPSRPSSSSQQLGSGVNNPERPNVPTRNTETPPPLEDDPVCRILLTSPIPGTNPIIVERRASQRLKEVRDYWCKRQGFDEAFSRTVFLTWRLHKLFDISTCKSLADKASGTLSKSKDRVEFDNDGIFSQIPTSNTPLSPSATNPFLEKSKGRITVEAMTEEHFVKAKQLARQKETNDNHTSRPGSEPPFINNSNPNTSSYPNINDPTTQPAPPTQPEPEVRILLRARPPLVPLKLKVRPSTSIWKIISAFKDQRIKSEIQEGNLSPETQVSLTFDGDVLDPDSIVGDTEIEDTDTVDVVVK